MKTIKNKKFLLMAGALLMTLIAAAVTATALVMGPTLAAPQDPPGTRTVGSWADFLDAWSNQSCPKIVLSGDITDAPGSSDVFDSAGLTLVVPARTASLEIDGRGHLLNVGNRVLCADNAAAKGQMLHVHDIALKQNVPNIGPSETYFTIFRDGTANTNTGPMNGNWIFRFGNITINKRSDTMGGACHLLLTFGSAVEFYGENLFEVSEEVMHCASVRLEDNTTLLCRKTSQSDTSMFYFFVGAWLTSGTAFEQGQGFFVGDNCVFVSYYAYLSAGSYPCVYYRYRGITVGENSVFAATMPGNAFRAQLAGTTHFTIGGGSVLNLTSLRNADATIQVSVSGFAFESAPGAEVYIVGNRSTNGIVNYSAGASASNPNRFTIHSPKAFDLRNKALGSGSVVFSPAGNCVFKVTDTDIDIWAAGSNMNGPSGISVMDVGLYQLSGPPGAANTVTQITTSHPDELQVAGARSDKYRRISGMNQLPEVLFDDSDDALINTPEDADKYVRVRALIGWTPHDDGVDENGNVEYIPVYAPANQVRIWMSSSDRSVESAEYISQYNAKLINDGGEEKWFLMTDADGCLVLPRETKLDSFLEAGTLLTAKANRGGRMGEEFTARVKDVTPPVPAQMNGMLLRGQQALAGRGGENGAKVTVSVNNAPELNVTATVGGNGSWKLELPGSLQLRAGDQLRIFMTDAQGNKNPLTDTKYHDAVFPAASVFTVQEPPVRLYIRQIVRLSAPNRFVPDAGYVTVQKRGADGTVLEAVNAAVNSGLSETDTPYTLFTYPPMAVDSILVKAAVSQYYAYKGCRVSGTEGGNGAQSLTAGDPSFTATDQEELWITLYLEPRENATSYYSKDSEDNHFGVVRLPVPPAMTLTADSGIGGIGNKQTVRVASQNSDQLITVSARAWGDGISGDAMHWSVSGGNANITGLGPSGDSTGYSLRIRGGNVTGSIRIKAVSVDNPALSMEFTIQMIDLVIMNTDINLEMSQGFVLRAASSSTAQTALRFSASKDVRWEMTRQTGIGARLASVNGIDNLLVIPPNYRGIIYVQAGIRAFRIIVTKGDL
ncbi:MAG: hypothetical protein FWH26_09915 [Oscillospiraceae bacterium]|nr:hypothetical protein [Oscillospiraceae bacterium]